MAKHTSVHLTARSDIGSYRKGDHVEDEAEVNAILASEHRHHFVRVAADVEPEAAVLGVSDAAGPVPPALRQVMKDNSAALAEMAEE